MELDKIEFVEGKVQVVVEARRSGGGDWGVTFRVFGEKGGGKVELLRFDCFKKQPHFHYDPMGRGETHNFDRDQIPDPLTWVMGQLSTQLPSMVEHAGFGPIAAVVDQKAVAADLARLKPEILRLYERAIRELAVSN